MSEENKVKNFEKALRENLEKYAKYAGFSSFDKADPRTKGLTLLRFYLYEIFINFNDTTEDEIENNITDRPNDIGIDFCYIDDDQVTIIQSKYGKSPITKEVLEHFISLPNIVYREEYIEKKAHSQINSIIKEIRQIKNPHFKLIFLANQKVDDAIFYISEGNKKENTDCIVIDFSRLKEEYTRVSSIGDLPPDTVIFEISNEDHLELNYVNENYRTVIITQKGTKLKNMYNQYKETLFNYNIRYWLGKNAVNLSMIETIKNEPDRFFYYNNGVSAVCEEIAYNNENTQLICKKFQIINGAQTVTTIAKENTSNLSKVKVLLRIIEGEKGKHTKEDKGLNENIVKNNNNQTSVSISDFRSNDKIQCFIHSEASKLKYTVKSPFKDIYYKHKRRKIIEKPTSKIITMQDLGKSYYAFTKDPHTLNASIKELWDTSPKGLYNDVFGNNGKPVDILPPSTIYNMFGSYFIYDYIKNEIKDKDKEECPAMLFKYHILWGIGTLLRIKYKEEEINKILSLLVQHGHYLNPEIAKEKHDKFKNYYNFVINTINLNIKRKKKSEETFVIRNSQRNKTFTDYIEDELKEMNTSSNLENLI